MAKSTSKSQKSRPRINKKEKGTDTPKKIRPELNLEKWSIWQPARSKSTPTRKVLQREVTLANGSQITARVEVGYTDRGALTTEDQKTYYALIKHWEDSAGSTEQISFSLKGLAKILKKRWGTNVIESISQSLTRLRATPFIWRNSYYYSATGETIKILDTFNILSELKITQRELDGVVNRGSGYFKFNDFILKNLLANHTKPLFLDTILSFKSEIAQLLYSYFDLIMADKNHYERRTRELFNDLELRGTAYKNPANRKQKLQKALEELGGVLLTTGVITSATLERTVDKKDYKIVIHKNPLKGKPELPNDELDEASEPTEEGTQQETEASIDQINSEAEEIVKYFYERFHDAKKVNLSPKALEQAAALITDYGYDQARNIIDFSHEAAKETDYNPQTFGGILQYSSRAMAEYDQKIEAKKDHHELELKRQEKESQEREQKEVEEEELNQFYESLSAEEQEEVNREVLESLNANQVVSRQLREQGDEALTSPMVRAFFEEEHKKVLRKLNGETR